MAERNRTDEIGFTVKPNRAVDVVVPCRRIVTAKEIASFPAKPHNTRKILCEGDEWRLEELLLWLSTLTWLL